MPRNIRLDYRPTRYALHALINKHRPSTGK